MASGSTSPVAQVAGGAEVVVGGVEGDAGGGDHLEGLGQHLGADAVAADDGHPVLVPVACSWLSSRLCPRPLWSSMLPWPRGLGPENEKPPTMWTVEEAHTSRVCAYSIMTTERSGCRIGRTSLPRPARPSTTRRPRPGAHPGPTGLVTRRRSAPHRRRPAYRRPRRDRTLRNMTETTTADPGHLRPAAGRARGPDDPGPGRDRPGHRGGPGPRRPVARTATTTPPRTPRGRWSPGSASSSALLKHAEIVDDEPAPATGPCRRVGRHPPLRGRRRGRHAAVLRRLDRGAPRRAAPWSPRARRSARPCSGTAAGDMVEYEAPGGTLRVEIVQIGS